MKTRKTLPKVGAVVTLAEPLKAYGCGFPTFSGYAYIPAGSVGTVGATRVPSVYGIRGAYFCCVDFPPAQVLHDDHGRPIQFDNRHNNKFRAGAFPSDLVAA